MIGTFETHPLTEKRRGVHVGNDHHVCNVTCNATHVPMRLILYHAGWESPRTRGFFLFLGERSSDVSEPFCD